MPAFFRLLALAVLLVSTLAAPSRAAEPLSPEQKQAVEAVIHDYFLKNPEFMVEVLRAAEAKIKQDKETDARQAIATYHNELVADATSPVGGNPEGDVTIVEFFDYRCPYCKQVEPAIEALVKQDSKIRIVYKEFPVLGADSVFASRMALGRGEARQVFRVPSRDDGDQGPDQRKSGPASRRHRRPRPRPKPRPI